MTALVLKTLSDLGCGNSRWNEELHFSVDETFFERRTNPMQFIVKPKVFFFRASFFRWRQNLLLYHMYHFSKSMMRTKSTRALSFLFFLFHSRYQHFAGQNDQLRLKSSKAALKAFQMIFPWLKMK